MKTTILMFLSLLGYFWAGVTAEGSATCRVWKYQKGLGGGKTGSERICAEFTGKVNVAEGCSPDSFLCNVQPNLDSRSNCTEFFPLPWKANLPPGDSCSVNEECQGRNCTQVEGRGQCIGIARNAS
jgi:hypothetical protein